MNVFSYTDYKEFVLERIRSMPKRGHGEFQRIANHLKMHSTRISHVFRGNEDLSPEQACALCEHFGMTELETEYFVCLVQYSKAGTTGYQAILKRQISGLKEQGQQLSKRITSDRVLSEADRALFYSHWYYSGIRALVSLPGNHNVDTIAARFGLPRALVADALQFLVSRGLIDDKEGKLSVGPLRTHLPSTSPMISRLHSNWRQKAMEHYPKLSSQELALTAPMSLTAKDAALIRETLAQVIEKVIKTASESESEKLYCLNIDWFEF